MNGNGVWNHEYQYTWEPVMASVETIRNFKFYDLELVEPKAERLSNRVVPIRHRPQFVQVTSDRYSVASTLDFPVVLDCDCTPWVNANLYLVNEFKNVRVPNPRTLKGTANNLCAFLCWLESCSIDYLDFDHKMLKLPTYRYERYLRDKIFTRKLASTTAVNKMNAVIQFYRWLQTTGKAPPAKLWQETSRSIRYSGSTGATSIQKIIVTDLTSNLRRARQVDLLDGRIRDGGALRPLQNLELAAVRQALDSIGNTEMSLAFDIAVLTGARLGTVFTLRVDDFAASLSSFDHIPKIRIGGTSHTNNKFGKEMVLLIPPKLYQRVQIYIKGQRYLSRKSLSPHRFTKTDASEYVFLTKFGSAYYHANNDENLPLLPATKQGNAVTKFIGDTLRPKLIKSGHTFPFKFHDLRATFGVGLVEWEVQTNKLSNWGNENSPDYLYIFNYIRERMGHSSFKTTEAYLTYKTNKTMLKNIQSGFEDFMFEFITDNQSGS